jgi:hypothetical protein
LLDDPRFEEMFWYAWRITPLGTDPESDPSSDGFWDLSQFDHTIFRCETSGAVVNALWAGSKPVREGRLILRGAYVFQVVRPLHNPALWLWLLLLGRRGW